MIPSPRSTNGRPRPIGRRMPTFEPWDIVKVPFPYTDRPVRQNRPALVIAADELQAAHGLLWLAMTASAVNRSAGENRDNRRARRGAVGRTSTGRPIGGARLSARAIVSPRLTGSCLDHVGTVSSAVFRPDRSHVPPKLSTRAQR